MNKYYATGGLGDAAIAFLQLPPDSYVIHCELHKVLLPSIAAFYSSQGIPNEVKLVNMRENLDVMKLANYIRHDVGAYAPFPKIKFKKIEGVDVVINPISGRDKSRRLQEVDELIRRHPHRHFTQTDWTATSTISHLVNLICSANTVISPEGFVAFFGGMAAKEVYATGDIDIINRRRHPEWDFHHIVSLAEVKL